jgi:hypothetical protein
MLNKIIVCSMFKIKKKLDIMKKKFNNRRFWLRGKQLTQVLIDNELVPDFYFEQRQTRRMPLIFFNALEYTSL